MGMLKILAPFLFSFSAFGMNCPVSPPQDSDLGYQKLKAYLVLHQKEIQSVSTLLSCLPERFYKTAVFISKSRSPERRSIDKDHPRVVLTDGRLYIAFTGLSGKPDFDLVQVIDSDQNGGFGFNVLDYRTGNLVLHESPQFCMHCHQGKPIWGAYRQWSGFLGSQSDLEWESKNQDEYFQLLRFLDQKKNHPRYQRVISHYIKDRFVEGSPQSIQHNRFQSRVPYAPKNSEFGELISHSVSQGIFQKLMRSPEYSHSKYLLAGIFLGCSLPKEVEKDFEDRVVSSYPNSEITQSYWKNKKAKQGFDAELKNLAMLNLISASFGVLPQHWDTRFRHEFRQLVWYQKGPSISANGETEMRDRVFNLLIKKLAQSEPSLKAIAERYDQGSVQGYRLSRDLRESYGFPKEFTQECQALAPLILSEFRSR